MTSKKSNEEKLRLERESIAAYPDRPVSQSAYGRYADLTRQGVGNLVRRGVIELNKSGKVIPRQADNARAAIEQVRISDSSESTNEAEDGQRYKKARADREEANAQLAQVRLAEEIGKLVSRESVDAWIFEATRAATKSLESLPKILAPKLALMSDAHEIQQVIAVEIREVLEELSRRLNAGG